MGRPKKNPEQEGNSKELAVVEKKENTGVSTADDVMNMRRLLENFKKILDRAPHPNYVKEHDGYKYIPISIVQKELDRYFFGMVQYEIISYQQILNEFVVHARLKVKHPVTMEWLNYDGIGAGMFQQKSGTPIADFYQHKIKNTGKITVPNAYAEAIKNAAKKIGKRFGGDLNRVHEDFYAGILPKEGEAETVN